MPTLFLHIGGPKTGSTYLQRTMLENAQVLSDKKVVFNAHVNDKMLMDKIFNLHPILFQDMQQGCAIGLYLRHLLACEGSDFIERLRCFVDMVANGKPIEQSVFISHECLCNIPFYSDKIYFKRLTMFAEEIGCDSVHLILTLRSLYGYSSSDFCESLKQGVVTSESEYVNGKSFDEYKLIINMKKHLPSGFTYSLINIDKVSNLFLSVINCICPLSPASTDELMPHLMIHKKNSASNRRISFLSARYLSGCLSKLSGLGFIQPNSNHQMGNLSINYCIQVDDLFIKSFGGIELPLYQFPLSDYELLTEKNNEIIAAIVKSLDWPEFAELPRNFSTDCPAMIDVDKLINKNKEYNSQIDQLNARYLQTWAILAGILPLLKIPDGYSFEQFPVNFNPAGYLIHNPDLLLLNQNPWAHYLKHGQVEGRVF